MLISEFNRIISSLGMDMDTELCFEPLSSYFGEDNRLPEEAFDVFGGVLTRADYYKAAEDFTKNILCSFADRGVCFSGFDGVIISPFAQIGAGTLIHPGTQIRRSCMIGANCVIGPVSIIENSSVGDGCIVNATQVYSSVLESGVKIGPFCHVRPNSRLCSGVKVGDFVEIKNSTVGAGTHASHLTYIGDSDVGERVNFGCGVVTVNYDGKSKFRTVIGDDAFIGCNTNLVAPVKIGSRAFTAAGSTITSDVPNGALAIERGKQANVEGWTSRRNNK